MKRIVRAELLDELPAEDPRAIRSRRDLRRLNQILRHAGYITESVTQAGFCHWGRRIVDLGSGDGTLCLHLVERLPVPPNRAEVVLIDQLDLISTETRQAFRELGWNLTIRVGDVFKELAQLQPQPGTAAVANLFLHHFSDEALARLLELVAEKCDLLVACEPRRSTLALTASKLVGLAGCGHVTRHDAVASVRAGFAGTDLTKLWRSRTWDLREKQCGLFSHCFMARRQDLASAK